MKSCYSKLTEHHIDNQMSETIWRNKCKMSNETTSQTSFWLKLNRTLGFFSNLLFSLFNLYWNFPSLFILLFASFFVSLFVSLFVSFLSFFVRLSLLAYFANDAVCACGTSRPAAGTHGTYMGHRLGPTLLGWLEFVAVGCAHRCRLVCLGHRRFLLGFGPHQNSHQMRAHVWCEFWSSPKFTPYVSTHLACHIGQQASQAPPSPPSRCACRKSLVAHGWSCQPPWCWPWPRCWFLD